ncbi:MAG: tRNA(Ile)-lysidine synthase [Tepidanaerobacteraceae bacterium]|nr:tRNA(Ile)-lysidine synthase [Tepidanaerobacteraceae bacterium]
MDVNQKFLDTISKYRMIRSGDTIMAGVSGGPDSVCLLHLLWKFAQTLGIRLVAAHLDHMFRGEESREDALFVDELCRKLNVPLFKEAIDVPAYIRRTGLSPEDAARRVRYGFFEKAMKQAGADKVALGHNRNDHEETVFMNIMRGSGIEGLVGIEPVRGVYIRPLLEISRSEIEEYLKCVNLDYRIDSSNLKTDYFRNSLRLELIPMIKQKYAPHFGQSLRRLSEIARCDVSFLEEQTFAAWQQAVTCWPKGVRVDLKKFNPLHDAIKRRLVRKAVEYLAGDAKDFEFRHTVMLVDFIKTAAAGSVLDMPKGLRAEKQYDCTIILPQNRRQIGDYSYEIPVPGRVKIEEAGAVIWADVKPSSEAEIIRTNPLIAHLDYDKIKGNLTVRNRRAGDRFIPLGGHLKKLQDFFTDEKIPRSERDRVPVVTAGEDIIWVAGMRIDDRFKITRGTRRVLILKMERMED